MSVFKENKYVSDHSEMMKLWSNSNIVSPNTVRVQSGKRAIWVCPLNHEWEAIIANVNKGRRCPYCAGKKILVGFTDMEIIALALLAIMM